MIITVDALFNYFAIGTVAGLLFIVLFLSRWLEKSSARAFPFRALVLAVSGTVSVLSITIGATAGTLSGYIDVVLVMLGLSITTMLVFGAVAAPVIERRARQRT